jgi:hypothetical protein
MDAKTRKDTRLLCKACRYEILSVNGKEPDQSQQDQGIIENICKGGFRFITSKRFELEDRITAKIIFTDGRSLETFGRICYCNEDEENGDYAYGFSIITGFIHSRLFSHRALTGQSARGLKEGDSSNSPASRKHSCL